MKVNICILGRWRCIITNNIIPGFCHAWGTPSSFNKKQYFKTFARQMWLQKIQPWWVQVRTRRSPQEVLPWRRTQGVWRNRVRVASVLCSDDYWRRFPHAAWSSWRVPETSESQNIYGRIWRCVTLSIPISIFNLLLVSHRFKTLNSELTFFQSSFMKFLKNKSYSNDFLPHIVYKVS